MSIHKYGDITIEIESLQIKDPWEEYGITISAPDEPTEKFRIWHIAEKDKQIVAQVLIYDLIQAYEDPQRFLSRVTEGSVLPKEYVSRDENRHFMRAANQLHRFLHQAHLDVYKEWATKPLATQKDIERPPREWMPTKKRK